MIIIVFSRAGHCYVTRITTSAVVVCCWFFFQAFLLHGQESVDLRWLPKPVALATKMLIALGEIVCYIRSLRVNEMLHHLLDKWAFTFSRQHVVVTCHFWPRGDGVLVSCVVWFKSKCLPVFEDRHGCQQRNFFHVYILDRNIFPGCFSARDRPQDVVQALVGVTIHSVKEDIG